MLICLDAFASNHNNGNGNGNGNNNGPHSSSVVDVDTSVINSISNRTNVDIGNTNTLTNTLGISDSGNSTNTLGQSINDSGNSTNTNFLGQGISDSGNANAHQNQTQSQTQQQDQSQSMNDSGNSNATQSQSASNAGNAQSVNMHTPKQHYNTPSAMLFVPPPTATCQNVIGAAGMGPGMGLSISGSYTNENCEILELAKALASIGQVKASYEVMCATKHGNLTQFCRKLNAQNVDKLKEDEKVDVKGAVAQVAIQQPRAEAGAVFNANHPNPWLTH